MGDLKVTYRGVAVPEILHPNMSSDRTEWHWFKKGVDAAQETSAPETARTPVAGDRVSAIHSEDRTVLTGILEAEGKRLMEFEGERSIIDDETGQQRFVLADSVKLA